MIITDSEIQRLNKKFAGKALFAIINDRFVIAFLNGFILNTNILYHNADLAFVIETDLTLRCVKDRSGKFFPKHIFNKSGNPHVSDIFTDCKEEISKMKMEMALQ